MQESGSWLCTQRIFYAPDLLRNVQYFGPLFEHASESCVMEHIGDPGQDVQMHADGRTDKGKQRMHWPAINSAEFHWFFEEQKRHHRLVHGKDNGVARMRDGDPLPYTG